jgi:hypothetical protein
MIEIISSILFILFSLFVVNECLINKNDRIRLFVLVFQIYAIIFELVIVTLSIVNSVFFRNFITKHQYIFDTFKASLGFIAIGGFLFVVNKKKYETAQPKDKKELLLQKIGIVSGFLFFIMGICISIIIVISVL